MKRILGVLLIFAFTAISLFASNMRKTYTMDDEVWIRTNRLCMATGHLGPSPVSPTTGAEIRNALLRLDYNSLSEQERNEYDNIMKLLEESDGYSYEKGIFEVDPSIILAPEFYAYNDTKGTYMDEFFIPYRDREAFLSAELHMFFSDVAYLDFQYMLKDAPVGLALGDDGKQMRGDLFYYFTNFSLLGAPGLDGDWYFLNFMANDHVFQMNVYQPFKVGLSLGNDIVNFYIGRHRQEFGNGILGNMILGDNFSYQDMMLFSVFSDVFSYYLSFTHFDNVSPGHNTGFQFNGPHQSRIIHRIDFNIVNKVRLTFNMGGLFVTDSPFDWRMLTPLMVVHNWGNNKAGVVITDGDEGNNIISLELEWAMAKGWFFSFQFVLDQMHVPGEVGDEVPNAFGAMLNFKNTSTIGEAGYLDSWIEFVYTNPYLYLNEKRNSDDGSRNYFYDFILGYGYEGNGASEVSYTGHSFGPDSIGIAVGTTFTSMDSNWTVAGSILYKVHGENGMERSYWSKQNSSNRLGAGESYNYNTPTGTPEHTLRINLGGKYKILPSLELKVETASFFIWNYHNEGGVFRPRIQSMIGLKYTII